ncbi:MAG: sarcosine oxidase subunit delta [Pseudomonadota bacterium]
MILPHPLLGPRDASEFVYLGDASLLDRPEAGPPGAPEAAAIERFHAYQHLRANPAGPHRELWFHEQGDRSLLVVTRDTVTQQILSVELARDAAR